jgi:hypothetical protein
MEIRNPKVVCLGSKMENRRFLAPIFMAGAASTAYLLHPY